MADYDILMREGNVDGEDTVIRYSRKGTLLHMRIHVNSSAVRIKINSKELYMDFTPSELYELGYTQRVLKHPWLLKYDDTNNVYVVVLEDLEISGLEIRLEGTCDYSVWAYVYAE